MSHSSISIANEFIRRAKSDGATFTQMQLQKLVYIAHGWNLAIQGTPLTSDTPKAWDYGPVYPDIWDALRVFGRAPVTKEIDTHGHVVGIFDDFDDVDGCEPAKEFAAQATLNTDETNLIDQIYKVYGKYHAFQLSAMTHKEDTPWHQTYVVDGIKHGEISDVSIREHFTKIGQERTQA